MDEKEQIVDHGKRENFLDPNTEPYQNKHAVIMISDDYHEDRLIKRIWRKCSTTGRENLLLILLLTAVIVGIGLGFFIRGLKAEFTEREIMYISFPGELLMRMLRMLILPLIVSSLIAGIAGLDARTCGKMGLRTMAYFSTTTILAVILGIILSVSIKPGGGAVRDEIPRYGSEKKVNSVDTFLDLVRNIFPDNLITSCFQSIRTSEINKTKVINVTLQEALNGSSPRLQGLDYIIKSNITNLDLDNDTEIEYKYLVPVKDTNANMNVLGLVVFSVSFGIIIGRMGEKGKPLMNLCNSLADATMRLFSIFIWYSPVGIMFLIAGKVVGMENFSVLLGKVGLYFLTVIAGLFIHGSVILPAIYFISTRMNPYRFMLGILQALATAFGTSSSSATMPVTLHCLETNNGIDPRVSAFVIPVGATINMDGTALYEAVAALFIAQVNDMDMDFGEVVTISITATAASIGAAGVPQAGLVTMVIVLSAVGLPTEDMTLILVVDWFLDRFRTMTNVLGDCLGAGIVNHFSKSELPQLVVGHEFRASMSGPSSSHHDHPKVPNSRSYGSVANATNV